MSRVLASILMVILLIQGVFQTLELRYCSGKVVSVELNGIKGVCSCNEESNEVFSIHGDILTPRSCCDFETLSIASADYSGATEIEPLAQDSEFRVYTLSPLHWAFFAFSSSDEVYNLNSSPPRKRKLASFILLNQFRAFLG